LNKKSIELNLLLVKLTLSGPYYQNFLNAYINDSN